MSNPVERMMPKPVSLVMFGLGLLEGLFTLPKFAHARRFKPLLKIAKACNKPNMIVSAGRRGVVEVVGVPNGKRPTPTPEADLC